MMKLTGIGAAQAPMALTVDLNDLLLDHPAASFIFRLGEDLAIVDRVVSPDENSVVVVEYDDGFVAEPYQRQIFFGVVTYRILRVH